jgi:hypothetical protein
VVLFPERKRRPSGEPFTFHTEVGTVGMLLGLVLIISVIVWGTAFTAIFLWRQIRSPDRRVESEVTARLLEEVDNLSTRLAHVEEELDFYRKLRDPGPSRSLPDPERPSKDRS